MLGHEQFDRGLDRLAANVEIAGREDGLRGIGADVWLFAGEELGVDGQAVLEIVDAQLRGFAEADGAQVSCDFHVVLVSSFNHRLQLFARDVVINLV